MHRLLEKFANFPARRRVVETMLRCGLRVSQDGRILCDEIELPPAKIARALKLDRRVVIETAKTIARSKSLFEIFSELRPTAFIGKAASKLGFEVIEIEADPHLPGIVAAVSAIIAKRKISIRQVVTDDPDIYPSPKMTVIIEKKLPGEALNELRKVKGVTRVSFT